MPLMKGRSKKAFSENVEAEMGSGKPQKQALAIAYAVKKKSGKKKMMAKGGMVNESAASEHRPMPDERDKDAHMAAQNDGKRPLIESDMLSRPDIKQSTKGLKTTAIKHPRMVASDILQARLRDQEDDLMMSEAPAPPQDGPAKLYEEEYHLAEGGEIKPAKIARPDKGYGAIIHKAEGGEVSPMDELDMERHASIASAIMARKRAKMMAEGGMVNIDENAEEQPNLYYHLNEDAALKENYDSDMDDISQPMDSNEMADPREEAEEDDHDASVVSAIRSKMKKRSPIVR